MSMVVCAMATLAARMSAPNTVNPNLILHPQARDTRAHSAEGARAVPVEKRPEIGAGAQTISSVCRSCEGWFL
jgi:hypothetical protein